MTDLRAAFTGRLLTGPAEMAPFLIDWRRRWQGAAIAVAQPDTAQDVANLVAWCAAHNVPVVPQGAIPAFPAAPCLMIAGGRWYCRSPG